MSIHICICSYAHIYVSQTTLHNPLVKSFDYLFICFQSNRLQSLLHVSNPPQAPGQQASALASAARSRAQLTLRHKCPHMKVILRSRESFWYSIWDLLPPYLGTYLDSLGDSLRSQDRQTGRHGTSRGALRGGSAASQAAGIFWPLFRCSPTAAMFVHSAGLKGPWFDTGVTSVYCGFEL